MGRPPPGTARQTRTPNTAYASACPHFRSTLLTTRATASGTPRDDRNDDVTAPVASDEAQGPAIARTATANNTAGSARRDIGGEDTRAG